MAIASAVVSEFSYYVGGEVCDSVSQVKGMLHTSKVNGLTTTNCYDAFGHKTKVSKAALLNDSDTQVTTISSSSVYSTDGRVVSTSTDAAGFTTTYEYDGFSAANSVSGIINSVTATDANGLVVTKYSDDWGKEIAVESSAAAVKTTETAYCVAGSDCTANAYYYQVVAQEGAPEKRVEFDKFGRDIASRVQHFADNTYSYTFKDYDSKGRISKEYIASFSSTRGSDYKEYHYDKYDRVTSVDLPNSSAADYQTPTTTFAGYSTTQTDALGKSRTEERNALGQLVKVTDAIEGTLTYVYDAYGNLKTVTKAADSINIQQVSNTYDDYGQKTQMTDIDKGTWHYRYNGFGKLVWQQNANDDEVTTEYDTIGRKVRQYAYDNTQCWIYGDANSTYGKGKLHKTKYFDGQGEASCSSNAFSQGSEVEYDSAGRAYHSKQVLNNVMSALNGEYHTYNEYDSAGRVSIQSYPGLGLRIRHGYQNGYAYKLADADRLTDAGEELVYQQVIEMNASGQVKQVTYANGATEAMAYFDETGLVKSHTLTKSGTSLHNLSYTYAANGNLNTRSHAFGVLSNNIDYSEEYTYDDLHRLTGRTVTTGDQTAYSMNQGYAYDGFGNFTSKDGAGYYKYDANKRLTGIYNNSAFTGTPTYDFDYDNNGNIKDDGNRSLVYASFDKVIQIYQGNITTAFTYGMGHKRYYRHDLREENGGTTNTHTAYLGGLEKIYRSKTVDGSASRPELEYKFTVGNVVITERANAADNASTGESYLHKDHLGSPLTITDENGAVMQQQVFDPWGKAHQLAADNSLLGGIPLTTRGYTGHEGVAGLDIIHMNGRIYDATIGRFLQADPHIQSPKDSQSYNRYAYVLNNPLSATDPSGYFFKKLKKYWRPILAAVVAVVTYGAASGWAASWAASMGMTASVTMGGVTATYLTTAGAIFSGAVAGAITGAASGLVATGSLKGAARGALSGGAFGALGGTFPGV